MRDYAVSVKDVGREAGVGAGEVEKALDLRLAANLPFLMVARVHDEAEYMLRQRGGCDTSRKRWEDFGYRLSINSGDKR